jgi:hypothetical protein
MRKKKLLDRKRNAGAAALPDANSTPTLLSTSYLATYDIEPGSAARIANHRDPADLFAQTVTCLKQLK